MKKSVGIVAVALAACCAVGVTGCRRGSTETVAALNSNWYADTTFKGIQPTITEGNNIFEQEKIVYTVAFDGTGAGNQTYSVSYEDGGTYTTTFYGIKLSKENNSELFFESYKDGYPDEMTVYYYETVLEIPSVTFTFKGETKKFDDERVETHCYFLPVADYLRPVYSYQSVKSTSPNAAQAKSLEDTYVEIERKYENFYSYDGKEVTTRMVDHKNNDEIKLSTTKELDEADSSLFDVNELNIAVRASGLTPDLAQYISLYVPEGGVQNYYFGGSSSALEVSAEELTTIKTELSAYGLNPEDDLAAVAVSVQYNGALSGVSQTYWFASVSNRHNNKARATMLKLSTPLTYNLGKLNYTLHSIENPLWNGQAE